MYQLIDLASRNCRYYFPHRLKEPWLLEPKKIKLGVFSTKRRSVLFNAAYLIWEKLHSVTSTSSFTFLNRKSVSFYAVYLPLDYTERSKTWR